MRAFIRSTIILASLLAPAAVSAAEDVRTIVTVKDADYFGFDLRTVQNVTLDDCKATCIDDLQCKAFTFNTKAQWCFLKSDFKTMNPFVGAVAGKIVMTAAEPDIGAAPPLTFLSDSSQVAATAFKQRLNVALGQEAMGLDAIVSKARSDSQSGAIDQSVLSYQTALFYDPDNFELWMELADTAARVSNNYSMGQVALAASINAYRLTRTTGNRAEAVELIARALANNSAYRPAINAYKASLALKEDPAVRAAYADLVERQGFRTVGNTIDADSTTPRACIQFSEPLVKVGVDYSAYVLVNGATPKALEAKNNEICIEGLSHGERYQITLREGLPSSVDEPLRQQVDITAYIKDRSPSVRFTGDSFVLPSTARRGIPLVSINTTSAKLELYRIGDRNLASILTNSQFLTQLDGYRMSQIESDQGEKVWQGEIDITNELNKDVITSIPIDEALPERKPGVYVLTAASNQGKSEYWDSKATQWFVVSDIGLTTYAGADGLNVFARSLASAKPLAGVTLNLLARNNEVLGTAKTDAEGRAILPAGLMRGTAAMTPAVLTAADGSQDYVFLDMTRAGFDLSDRGVTGRPAPGAIDILAYTERGIYRPGETVHLATLTRDISGTAIENLPLTYIFSRPDGVEDRRIVSDGGKLGGQAIEFELQKNAMRGNWTVRIYTDPKQASLVDKTFMVDDFVPDRIEFDLASTSTQIASEEPATVTVDGRFLYGAPAAGLTIEGDIVVTPTRTRESLKGYQFGMVDEEAQESTRAPIEGLEPLDADGKATFEVSLPEVPATTQFLDAKIVIRMSEAGGRAVERDITLPVKADGPKIGIKPAFAGDLSENSIANFHVISVNEEGEKQATGKLRWKLLEVNRRYQWYRDGTSWRYEPISTTKKVAEGTFEAGKDGENISMPVTWGRYRLEVESLEGAGPVSSVEFDAGWYVEASSTETPDGLEIALDKQDYKVGDTARLNISPRFAGEALITIGSETVLKTINASIAKEGGVVEIPVTEDFGGGAYVTATLFRPGNDQESRMPMRAIGLKWLKVDPGDSKLKVAIDVPEKTEPRKPLEISVGVNGAAPGEMAYVTIAAVDVGILNLTRYETPNPEDYYFGQRQLGLEIRDLYGRLIDGSLGVTGRLRTGGDGGEEPLSGDRPTEKLVAFFEGPVELDENGLATVSFDIPQFNGTVRVMAVAWTKKGVGHAERDVIIRDPIVVTASLPKFLAPDDSAELRLDIANTDAPAGTYRLEITANDQVKVDAAAAPSSVTLEKGGKSAVTISLKGGLPGIGELTVALVGENGLRIDQTMNVDVRPQTLPMTEKRMVRLEPGRGLLIDDQLLAGSYMQGASISLNMTRNPAFDVPALLMALDRYPYGCAEQTTSRALPLLYLSDLSNQLGMAQEPEVRQRVQDAIYRVLNYQSSVGSFGLWGPGSGDLWLDSYVTDFLTRAREQKYLVPEQAMVAALDNLENVLGYDDNVSERGNEMAYAIYVLARNKRAAISDLRYYADTMLDQFPTQLAKAQIAAALSLYGDVERSEKIFTQVAQLSSMLVNVSLSRSDYGSALRDDAAILALAAESKPTPPIIREMTDLVSREWERRSSLSTQEQTWLTLAARGLKEADKDLRITVNGELKTGGYKMRATGEDILVNPVNVVNQAQEPITAVLTTVAAPREPLTAGGNGFEISRSYYTLDGEEANISEATQNERYVAVIKVTQLNDWATRLVVTDLLPAGFTIDNPGLVSSASLTNFSWLPQTEAAHLEFRYDRFTAALNYAVGNGREFTLAYVVRAVNPGTYAHPAAVVEDMYRPEFAARTAAGVMQVFRRGGIQ